MFRERSDPLRYFSIHISMSNNLKPNIYLSNHHRRHHHHNNNDNNNNNNNSNKNNNSHEEGLLHGKTES